MEFHLRLHAVAAPGGSRELADLVAHAHAIPLDRSRPLWELWVIDGLADGRVALYAKMHMAAIDDVTGAEVMTALLDTDPTGVRPEAPEPADGSARSAAGAAVRRRRPTSCARPSGSPHGWPTAPWRTSAPSWRS